MELKNNRYFVFTVILSILSIVGIVLLFQIIKNKNSKVDQIVQEAPVVTVSPTISPTVEILPEATTSSKVASSSSASAKKITPTPTATPIAKLTPTLKPTAVPTIKLTPTPKPTLIPTPTTAPVSKNTSLTFSNQTDTFSVNYLATRKEYTDKEISGNRYTFTNPSGNFAVHVGLNNKWAWVYPDRSFNSNFTISGLPTSRYDINTQTIVDFQANSKNYTIQCIHNGNSALKSECEDFIKSFKIL